VPATTKDEGLAGVDRYRRTGLVVTVLLSIITQGCGGVTGPPRLSRSEQAAVVASRLDLRLGVRDQGESSAEFVALVRERQLFREVNVIAALDSPPDLEATIGAWGAVNGDNPLPFFTFLTLGFFPTIGNNTQRWEVIFTSPPRTEPTIRVVYEYQGTTVIGWPGLFATIAPGWMFPDTQRARMMDHFMLAIVGKSDDLRALAGRTRPSDRP
jgi:hypothetical protein